MVHTSLHQGLGLQQAMLALQAWAPSHHLWLVLSLPVLVLLGAAGATNANPFFPKKILPYSNSFKSMPIVNLHFACLPACFPFLLFLSICLAIYQYHSSNPFPSPFRTHYTFRQSVQNPTHCHYIAPIIRSTSHCLTKSLSNLGLLRLKKRIVMSGAGAEALLISFFSVPFFLLSSGGRPMFFSSTFIGQELSISRLLSHVSALICTIFHRSDLIRKDEFWL